MRHQRLVRLVPLLLAVSVFSSGCTLARIYATSGNAVSLTQTDPSGGEPFKIHHRIMFDYTGAIDIQEHLREKYGSGNEFQNVSVKIQYTVSDYFLNLITLGIANSQTFEVMGDKVRKQ